MAQIGACASVRAPGRIAGCDLAVLANFVAACHHGNTGGCEFLERVTLPYGTTPSDRSCHSSHSWHFASLQDPKWELEHGIV